MSQLKIRAKLDWPREVILSETARDLQPYTPQELTPEVILVTEHKGDFLSYQEMLNTSGFPCSLYDPDEPELYQKAEKQLGAVVFISWNLSATSAKALADHFHSKFGLESILFAEEEGVQTATLMSSSGHPKTIQHPYNEKNFVMAMNTIVKERQAEDERRARKRKHQERMGLLSAAAPQEQEASDEELHFTHKEEREDSSAEVHSGQREKVSLQLVHSDVETVDHSAQIIPEEREKTPTIYSERENDDSFFHSQGEEADSDLYHSSSAEDPSQKDRDFAEEQNKQARGQDEDDLVAAVLSEMDDESELGPEFISPSPNTSDESPNEAEDVPMPSNLPHQWVKEGELKAPTIDRRGASLSRTEIFWMCLASAVGLAMCGFILIQVFLNSPR